ncbi:CU044_5270 family protein [Embleya sp. AB8]|uniref:CU044_5270 family protein n=1 Tax=Embleya sp. AB8 TaxID=3156304 RepID=UPI003C709318
MKHDPTAPSSPDRARPGCDPTERALAQDAHPSAARQRLLEEHLMREITAGAEPSARSRRRPSGFLAPIGAMIAVGAVVAVVLVAAPNLTPSRPAHASGVAIDATAAPMVPRPGQCLYVELELSSWGEADGAPAEMAAHSRKEWFSQDGRRWFLDEVGAPVTGLVLNDPPMAWNYAELAALPTDPDAMSAAIRRRNSQPPESSLESDRLLLKDIGEILNLGVLPPGVTEALYEVVARMPGVSARTDVVDGRGRRGIALTRIDPTGRLRVELIFDRGARTFLGSRGVLVAPDENHPIGTVMWQSTVVERAIVDNMPGDPTSTIAPSSTSGAAPARRS